MYDCNVTAADKDNTNYNIRCEDVLVDASSKIPNILADSVENFDLSKLKDFDVKYLVEDLAEEYDVTSKSILKRFEHKIKTYLYNFSNVNIKNATSRYILLPFYYGEFGGKVVLVNGQKGNVFCEVKNNIRLSLKNDYTTNANLTIDQVSDAIMHIIKKDFITITITLMIIIMAFYANSVLICDDDITLFIIGICLIMLLLAFKNILQIRFIKGYVEEKPRDKSRNFLSKTISGNYYDLENMLLKYKEKMSKKYLIEGTSYINDVDIMIEICNLQKLKQREDWLQKCAKKNANKYIKRIEKID